MKTIKWARVEINDSQIVEFLNTANFQPGKFLIIPWPLSKRVTIVYVESEK